MSLPTECSWINSEDIRPYFFVRKKNWFKNPGSFLKDCNWFNKLKVLKKNPLSMKEEKFSKIILEIESRVFHQSGMPMPGWVFYDCGLMPGIVTGFAYKTSKLPKSIQSILSKDLLKTDWTPLSLFIAIPCGNQKEWIAHNLSSINALLPKKNRLYGLGFLSKSFGLWYSNIKQICGMTQWQSQALKLHVNYGNFEILTAYTPIHSHPQTLTYRCTLNFNAWERFFNKTKDSTFTEKFEPISGLTINPTDQDSLINIQSLIEKSKESFYLKPDQIKNAHSKDVLNIYKSI